MSKVLHHISFPEQSSLCFLKCRTTNMMNERFFLKLLLALFSGLIVAELLVVALFGFRVELILLCFILVAALTGIVLVARLLVPGRSESESVSMRRARAAGDATLRDRFQGYGVDEEFLGGDTQKRAKGSSPASPKSETRSSTSQLKGETPLSLEQAIRLHAEMYGGLRQLLQMMDKIDDAAFARLKAKAGLGRVSRSEVICQIRAMSTEEEGECCEELNSSLEETIRAFSSDRESFDEYIRRSMTTGESQSCGDDGFAVELDSNALSRGGGTMPANFSHDPKEIIASLKRAGAKS